MTHTDSSWRKVCLLVLLATLLLTTIFVKRGRSSHSRWSLVARVAKQEVRFLLDKSAGADGLQLTRTPGAEISHLDLRLPSEFESQRGLLLSGHLANRNPDIFCAVVAAVSGRVDIVVWVTDEAQLDEVKDLIEHRNLSAGEIAFVRGSHTSKWVRDFAPMAIWSGGNRTRLVDMGSQSTQDHRAANFALASHVGVSLAHNELHIDGGNLLSNGEGLFLTTSALLSANPGYRGEQLADLLAPTHGVDQLVVLERLDGETTGHVDMFATFTDANTVVLGSYSRVLDPENAAVLNRNAERLAKVRTRHGPLRVVRIPMPSNTDGNFRTYTNVIYANGVLLLPVYSTASRQEQEAIRIFSSLLPGWKIVRIDSDDLIQGCGALHCVSMNLASISDLGKPKMTMNSWEAETKLAQAKAPHALVTD